MKRFILTVVVSCIVFLFTIIAQPKQYQLNDPLPPSPGVRIGKLANGLTYYIRSHGYPEKKAELRLVIKAGSVVESDNESGLMHYICHMAYNGTKHFTKGELTDFLSRTGFRFGPHLNSNLSFDETVYMLRVASDSLPTLQTAFQILQDWAAYIKFDEKEIKKEQKYILKEIKEGRDVESRTNAKVNPVLLSNSQYAKRPVVGKKNVVQKVTSASLKKMYTEWYRTELMAVVAVGDFHPDTVETLIRKYFEGLKNPANPRNRLRYSIPNQIQSLAVVVADSELSETTISINFKYPEYKINTVGDFRKTIAGYLVDNMASERLRIASNKANPPFAYSGAEDMFLGGDKRIFSFSCVVPWNGIEKGFDALLTETMRLQRYGFTQPELDRQKTDIISAIIEVYNGRAYERSANYADEYVRHFVSDEPIPGIENEVELYRQLVPTISLDEVNKLIKERIHKENCVIRITAVKRPNIFIPSEKYILIKYRLIENKKIIAYADSLVGDYLLSEPPVAGKVVSESINDSLGTIEWKLSNGALVIAKRTDFRTNEVIITAYSAGGTSLAPDSEYISADAAPILVMMSGVGDYDAQELVKVLKGKTVKLAPFITETYEGFQGNSRTSDLQILLELLNLYVTQPRKDKRAFETYLSRLQLFVNKRSTEAQAMFLDTIQTVMAQNHYRARPITSKLYTEINIDKAFRYYNDRFGDVSDFAFFIVGDFSKDTLKYWVERYIGSLPSKGRIEKWKDAGIRTPKGVIEKTIVKGKDSTAAVQIMLTGEFDWSPKNRFDLQVLMNVLQLKLHQTLRGIPNVENLMRVVGTPIKNPFTHYRIAVAFYCKPDSVGIFTNKTFSVINDLKKNELADSIIALIKEKQKKENENNLKDNRYWLTYLSAATVNGENPLTIYEKIEWIEKLNGTTIRNAANRYLDLNNCVKVVLMPEKE